MPGPFTMSQQAQNDYYPSEEAAALDYAAAVNAEIRDLFAAGADVVQIDEPWLQARPAQAREYAVPAINRAVEGIEGTTALHTCFGYAHVVTEKPPGYSFLAELNDCAVDQIAIESAQPRLDLSILREIAGKTVILGVLDLADDAPPETADQVERRIDAALEFIAPERLQVAPDCGMKYLSRDVALAKLGALVQGAARVRARLDADPARPA